MDAGSQGALMAISNALVHLHKEAYGRGPTSARTYVQDDLCVCLLRGGYTRAEHTLRDHGEMEALRHHRVVVQGTMEDQARAIVREHLGRDVVSVMSATDPERDVSVEVFVLA
jgi:uncharacterized protein YbcI